MVTAAEKRKRLSESLASGRAVLAPAIFDMMSAAIADQAGFEVLFISGYGVSASRYGLPDAGLISLSDMEDFVRIAAARCETPLIADADTGYGGLLNVAHTVRRLEAAGAAALQLEDQESPKRCGHTQGHHVIPMEDMVLKIRVALEARADENTQIVARTDARSVNGFDDAMRRGEAYQKAGAHVLFIEAPTSIEEMEVIGRSFDVPVLINMVGRGSKTPSVSLEGLGEMGFRLIVFAGVPMLAAAGALKNAYETIKRTGDVDSVEGPMLPFQDMNHLVGFDDVWAFEERWSREGADE